MKTKKCQYCGNELPESGVCSHCGAAIFTVGCQFQYGKKKLDCCFSEVTLTKNGYLIVKNSDNSSATGVGMAAFGVLGALAGSLADSAAKAASPHAFYDMTDIAVVENPCPIKGRKPECTFRFTQHDSRDFVLALGKKQAYQFSEALCSLGLKITDMRNEPEDTVYCHNPLTDKKSFDKRVCASAAKFVVMRKDQFVAE